MDTIIKDPTKDVLVHVYDPEDDESELFSTDFENLAIALENITSVTLAKFDLSKNEHEDLDYGYEVRNKLLFGQINHN